MHRSQQTTGKNNELGSYATSPSCGSSVEEANSPHFLSSAAADPSAHATASLPSSPLEQLHGNSSSSAASAPSKKGADLNLNQDQPASDYAASNTAASNDTAEERSTVGIVLRGRIVDMIVAGGPADVSGQVHVGDEIIKVDDISVNNQTVIRAMRGAVGSKVVITLSKAKDGRLVTVPLWRTHLWGDIAPTSSASSNISHVDIREFERLLEKNAREPLLEWVTNVIAKYGAVSQECSRWKSEAESLHEQSQSAAQSATAKVGDDDTSYENVDVAALLQQLADVQASRDLLEAEAVYLRAQLRKEIGQLAQVEIDRHRADMEEVTRLTQQQLSRLTLELRSKTEDLRAAHESVGHLERQVFTLQQERTDLQEQTQQRISALTERNNALTLAAGAAEGRCEEQKATIERLLLELKNARDQLGEKERMAAEIKGIEAAYAALSQSMKTEQARSIAEKDRYERTVSNLETRLAVVDAERNQAVARLQVTIRDLDMKKENAEGKAAEATRQVQLLQKQLHSINEELESVKQKANLANVEYVHNSQRDAQRIRQLEDQIDRLRQSLNSINENQSSDAELKLLHEKIDQLKLQLRHSEDCVAVSNDDLRRLRSILADTEAKSAEDSLKFEKKIDNLERDNRQLELENARLKKSLQTAESRLSPLLVNEKAEERLRQQLESNREEFLRLQSTHAQLVAQYDVLNQKFKGFEKQSATNLFQVVVTGKAGVGLYIEQAFENNSPLVIKSVISGCSAHRSGAVNVGDIILSIDGVSTTGMGPMEASDAIIGSQGTMCTLRLLRGQKEFSIDLMRGTKDYIAQVEGDSNPLFKVVSQEKKVEGVVRVKVSETASSRAMESSYVSRSTLSTAKSIDAGAWV